MNEVSGLSKVRNTVDRKVWITWEDHRRSRELAEAFEAEYFPLTSRYGRLIRYGLLALRTICLIVSMRPSVLFVQNPSIILTALVCFLKPLHRAVVVVDRHTNYYFHTQGSREIKWRVYHRLSRWTDKAADLVIVTNARLAKIVAMSGATYVVLPDPIPNYEPSVVRYNKKRQLRLVCVASGASDEPIEGVINAVEKLAPDVRLLITSGGALRRYGSLVKSENVEFSGFLPDRLYVDTLKEADGVIVLTTLDLTLCCGAYEAVSLHRPMILSDFEAIKEHFQKGAVYVSADENSVVAGIEALRENWGRLYDEVTEADQVMRKGWLSDFANVAHRIDKIAKETAMGARV